MRQLVRAPRRHVAILGSRGYPSSYSGFETLVRHLATDLTAHDIDVSVYCRDSDRPARWGASRHGDVRQIFTPAVDRTSLSTLTSGFTASIDAQFRRYDAVLVLNPANGFFLPLLRARGIPTAVNVDGLEWERGKWNRAGQTAFRGGARCVARFADEIVVDSRAIGDRWQELFGRRGVFIPYGADVLGPRPTARVESLDLVPGSYGLVVARLVPENNIDLMLDAVESLDPMTPFVVVGSANYDNPVVLRLEAMAADRPVFRWLGHIDDEELLFDLWAHCGVYVHGHSVGGTNPSLLQALGAASPTLAFDSVFNREVVCNDDQLFQSREQLAGMIESVLANGEQRDQIARRGPEIVCDRYTWEACLAGYRELLERLADR